MTSARPSFDEALAFWRELLRARGLANRLAWIFLEDAWPRLDNGEIGYVLRPRSSGAGEWLARRGYRSAPAADTLVFTAYASADGQTVVGLQGGHRDTDKHVRRDDWNLLFDATCPLQAAHDGQAPDPSRRSQLDRLFSAQVLREGMTADEHADLRRVALQDLVLLTSPLTTVQYALKDLAWDSAEVWTLDKQHVLSILRRFNADEIAGKDVEAWANAIEMRDDVGYDRETAVWDVLYELANPTLTEPLTRERADVLASVLKGH
jgi:hypothetical protein